MKRLLLGSQHVDITLKRLCQEILENLDDNTPTVLVGLQPRGVSLAKRLHVYLKELAGISLPLGILDATFHRDDFKRDGNILKPTSTTLDFIIEDTRVILIDDVIASGRMVRAAMDAMQAYGRPASIQLLCLINRKYNRDLPIQPDYIGKTVNTVQSQKVLVEWSGEGAEGDNIWLLD